MHLLLLHIVLLLKLFYYFIPSNVQIYMNICNMRKTANIHIQNKIN